MIEMKRLALGLVVIAGCGQRASVTLFPDALSRSDSGSAGDSGFTGAEDAAEQADANSGADAGIAVCQQACTAPRGGVAICRAGTCDFECTPPAVRLGKYCRVPGARTWRFVPGSGTPIGPRGHHTVALDPVTNQMVVFGGQGINNYSSDLWVLQNANGLGATPPTWVPRPASGGPNGRVRSAAFFEGGLLALFGGDEGWGGGPRGDGIQDDLWLVELASSTTAWHRRAAGTPNPGPRSWTGHAAIGGGLLIFGGNWIYPSQEAWYLANPLERGPGQWAQVNAFDGPPSGVGSGGAIDDLGRFLYRDGNRLWRLENPTGGGTPRWVRVSTSSGAPARFGESIVVDPASGRALVFGGAGSNLETTSDLWLFEPASAEWSLRTPPGQAPTARYGHSAVYDAEADRMIVFGGFESGTVPIAELWILDHAFGVDREPSPDLDAGIGDGGVAPDAGDSDAGLAPASFSCGFGTMTSTCSSPPEYCFGYSYPGHDEWGCQQLPPGCVACDCLPSDHPGEHCNCTQDPQTGAITRHCISA